jgi:hypothetical protein
VLEHLRELAPGSNDKLIATAYSSSSRKRLSAALHSANRFAMDSGSTFAWPFSNEFVNKYILWALKIAINVYLSDFAQSHKLRGLDHSSCSNFIPTAMLKGARARAVHWLHQRSVCNRVAVIGASFF